MKKKFNIVDVIIIVVVVAVIVAGCFIYFNFKNSNNNASVRGSTAKIEFVIEVNNVTETVANSFKAAEGSAVSFGDTTSGSGTISFVEIVPFKKWVKNTEDGEYVVSEVPNKYTVNITIQSDVEKTDTSYTSGSEVICVGKSMSFNSFGIAAEGNYIIDLTEIK